jgi:TPR repeat protein
MSGPRHLPVALLMAVASAGTAIAGSLEDGLAAFQRRDYPAALRLLQPLASEGDNEPQFYVGIMYENGLGVRRDPDTAYRWYRIAADQDYAPAMTNLGALYATGEGVPQSYAEASAWWRRAADQGDATALNNLGIMYALGRGVGKDLVQAYAWHDIAASRYPAARAEEREGAIRARDAVAVKMTPAQLAEAKKRVREWKPRPSRNVSD